MSCDGNNSFWAGSVTYIDLGSALENFKKEKNVTIDKTSKIELEINLLYDFPPENEVILDENLSKMTIVYPKCVSWRSNQD